MTQSPNQHREPGAALLHLLDRAVTPELLAESTLDAAKPLEIRATTLSGLVLFRMGMETFALPAKSLRRATPYAAPTRIPHRSSSLLRGLCNIRGELVLCADLRTLLGLERTEIEATETRRMLVIGPESGSWAFEVDALLGIERIDESGVLTPPITVEHSRGAYVRGIVAIGNENVSVLDGERVLTGFKAALA